VRVLTFLFLFCLSSGAAVASTLAVWPQAEPEKHEPARHTAFETVLAAHARSYRDAPGDLPARWSDMVFRTALLAGYALALAASLPRGRPYAARAAAAMSRIRRTMARRPFER
jgi:hypothetical protein